MTRKYREEPPIAIVAMGGHAFMQKGEAGTIGDHERNAAYIARQLMCLIERSHPLVITHGNGPQVGSLLIQHETAKDQTPALPLDVLVAMTEGSLGYILQQSLLNAMKVNDLRRHVVTVVTQVFVDENDPAFENSDEAHRPVPGLAKRRSGGAMSGVGRSLKISRAEGGGVGSLLPTRRVCFNAT